MCTCSTNHAQLYIINILEALYTSFLNFKVSYLLVKTSVCVIDPDTHVLHRFKKKFAVAVLPFCGATGTLCFGLWLTLATGFEARVNAPRHVFI